MNHIEIMNYILENKNDEDFITEINGVCTIILKEQNCVELTKHFREYILSQGKKNIADNFNILVCDIYKNERFVEQTFVCTIYKLKICMSYIGDDDWSNKVNLMIDDIDIDMDSDFENNDIVQNKLVENNIDMNVSEFVNLLDNIFCMNM